MSTKPEAVAGDFLSASPSQAVRRSPARSGVGRWVLRVAAPLALAAVVIAVVQPQGLLSSWLAPEGSLGPVHVAAPAKLVVTLQEEGELKPVNSTDIKVEVQGESVTIQHIAAESTFVRKGDLLVRLSSDKFAERVETEELELRSVAAAAEDARQQLDITRSENASRIKKAEIDLELAKMEEKRYLEGDYEQAKRQVEINIAQATIDLNQTKDELAKSEPLREKGFVTESRIDELRASIEKAQMTVDMYTLELEILNDYQHPKSALEKRSGVSQAEEELEREKQRASSRERQAVAKVEEEEKKLDLRTKRFDRLKEQLAKTEIYAPIDGLVQYGDSEGSWRWGGNRIAVGERVFEGQSLMTIPDTSRMLATCRIHEADRHKVREGLRCTVKVPAVPGVVLSGRLSKIAQFADSGRNWWNPELKEHAAEIVLDDSGAALSPGDTALIEIQIEEVDNVLAVPVQCVHSRGPKNFVFVDRNGGEPVAVKLGRSSATMVEISEGIKAGDRVLMSAAEELLAKLPSAMDAGGPRAGGRRGATTRPAAAAAASQPTTSAESQPATSQPADSAPTAETPPK